MHRNNMISANVRVKHPFFYRVCECATFVESTCGDCMISLAHPRLCCHRAFFDFYSLAFLHEFWACDVIVIFFHGAGFCAMLTAICVPPSIRARVHACVRRQALAASVGAIPMGRAAEPHEIASVICFLLSDGASYCSGANIRVAGGRPMGGLQ
jgi:hypothetical protein